MNVWQAWPGGRGSLARPSDRLEAAVVALLLATGFAVVALGVKWGGAAADASRNEQRWAAATEYSVTATATGDAVSLPRIIPNGVTSWAAVDAEGRLYQGRSAGHPAVSGAIVGVITVLTGWTLLLLLWRCAVELFGRYHGARWAAEWEQVEPRWSGRAPRE